ncbi:hypothetical protein CJU89_4961 [Yarrowia sp. B02]|nr:hypothetical protein CJU89_4961 [Yarrowia sp. B02]
MVSLSTSTAFAILASLVAAQNPIVVSIANQIVGGIAAAKTDDSVSPEEATSELKAVIDVVTKNQDIVGLFSKALPIAMAGLDDKNFPELLSAAGKTLDAFEASPDYAKVSNGLHSALPHYDVQKAMANVQGNLVGVMGLVTPKLPELTPMHAEQWNRATMRVQSLAQDLGLSGNAPAFAKEEDAPTATGDSKPEATPTGGSDAEDDSNMDDSNNQDDSTVEDDSNKEDDNSTVEDDSTTGQDDSTEESMVEDESTVEESSEDGDDSLTTDKQVVGSEDSTDESSTDPVSSNTTMSAPIPNGTGIDQANGAASFNAQLAAGAVVMAAFAALI